MTKNQIEFAKLQESKRAAMASEDITRKRDSETQRHNVSTEKVAIDQATEQKRSNLAKESETHRSNVMSEIEAARSNQARERETARHNVASEMEQQRSNIAGETLQSRKLSQDYVLGQRQVAIAAKQADTASRQADIAQQRADFDERKSDSDISRNEVRNFADTVSTGVKTVDTVFSWIPGIGTASKIISFGGK